MKEKRQLDDQRKRITKQLDEETEYDRQRRLAIIQNILSTYKRAINADVTYKSLRPFNISCILFPKNGYPTDSTTTPLLTIVYMVE